MFNKAFWKDTAERTLYTMAETALGVITGASMLGDVNWALVGSSVALSGIVTVLKCVIMHKDKEKSA